MRLAIGPEGGYNINGKEETLESLKGGRNVEDRSRSTKKTRRDFCHHENHRMEDPPPARLDRFWSGLFC